jgi:hypothetical protein
MSTGTGDQRRLISWEEGRLRKKIIGHWSFSISHFSFVVFDKSFCAHVGGIVGS